MRNCEEIFEIDEVYDSGFSRINEEIYYNEYELFGNFMNEYDDNEIGIIKILANGKTGEVQYIPVYYCFENEEMVTNEEFLEYVLAKNYTMRFSKSEAMLSAMLLYEFNKLEDVTIRETVCEETELGKVLNFKIKDFKFSYRKYSKGDGRLSLNHKAANIDVTEDNIQNKWNEIMEQIKKHPSLRLDFVMIEE